MGGKHFLVAGTFARVCRTGLEPFTTHLCLEPMCTVGPARASAARRSPRAHEPPHLLGLCGPHTVFRLESYKAFEEQRAEAEAGARRTARRFEKGIVALAPGDRDPGEEPPALETPE